jgi:hypothetical protein
VTSKSEGCRGEVGYIYTVGAGLVRKGRADNKHDDRHDLFTGKAVRIDARNTNWDEYMVETSTV